MLYTCGGSGEVVRWYVSTYGPEIDGKVLFVLQQNMIKRNVNSLHYICFN